MNVLVKESEVSFNDTFFNCVFGKNGFSPDKVEGDEKTPIGVFSIDTIFFRADRLDPFKTNLEITPIYENFAWCDDPISPFYNQFITLPFAEGHERLWRDDELYDIVVVLSYNTEPVVKGKGSAIFMHVAKEDMKYTKGCVALEKKDLIALLGLIREDTKIEISA